MGKIVKYFNYKQNNSKFNYLKKLAMYLLFIFSTVVMRKITYLGRWSRNLELRLLGFLRFNGTVPPHLNGSGVYLVQGEPRWLLLLLAATTTGERGDPSRVKPP